MIRMNFKVCCIAILLLFCSTFVHSQEEDQVEEVTNLKTSSEDKQSEDLAIIGPNGAPIIASHVPGKSSSFQNIAWLSNFLVSGIF